MNGGFAWHLVTEGVNFVYQTFNCVTVCWEESHIFCHVSSLLFCKEVYNNISVMEYWCQSDWEWLEIFHIWPSCTSTKYLLNVGSKSVKFLVAVKCASLTCITELKPCLYFRMGPSHNWHQMSVLPQCPLILDLRDSRKSAHFPPSRILCLTPVGISSHKVDLL